MPFSALSYISQILYGGVPIADPLTSNVIIFQPNAGSTAPRPIIHRIITINEDGTYQTKGDHNKKQLTFNTDPLYHTDETKIKKEQIIGKAVFKIPFLGWPKIWATELMNAFV